MVFSETDISWSYYCLSTLEIRRRYGTGTERIRLNTVYLIRPDTHRKRNGADTVVNHRSGLRRCTARIRRVSTRLRPFRHRFFAENSRIRPVSVICNQSPGILTETGGGIRTMKASRRFIWMPVE